MRVYRHVPSVTVRRARPSDRPALCPLYWAFHQYHAERLLGRLVSTPTYADYDSASLASALLSVIVSGEADVLVAEVDGRPAGFAEVMLARDEEHPARASRRYGQLVGLYVDDRERGRGIGGRLTRAAEDWAAARGAEEMRLDLWAFPGNAEPFYQQAGYRPLSQTLVRPLAGEPGRPGQD